ncbi:hypothetical protein B0J15DRAFT_571537 [Fusarium solani]|jgi:hypothetical protein|uniref:Uncharacterized protein n=1 Tax=Fusarium solani TaxID=169388 RepID=A0A9P9GAW4_FUSSL|nr:uncharacterized protein B0J15DRAFT_571537 [Fusarium solani]KAH7234367.1 hypothetical protein B0J15DRAFT_571537 [Fusarium solani]
MPAQAPLTHLQLIAADSISALYDNDTETLFLKASGKHVDITRDITFHRLPFTGGLLFQLQGWVGPIINKESPYSITQGFNIQLPSRVFPSNTVIVNTENKKSWVIPIHPLLKDGRQESQAAPDGEAPPNIPEVKVVSGNSEIVTGLGQTFTLKQSDSFKGQGGTVNVAFDRNYISLINAGIDNGNIEWNFTSQQVGATEVGVFVGQSNPPFMYRVVYDVSIVPPNDATQAKPLASFSVSPANGSSNGSKVAATKKNDASLPLSWDGFVNIGFNIIKQQFPDAKLYEIDATPATTEPVEHEWGLVNNRIVASLDGNRTAIIQSNGWGSFGPVDVIQSPFVGDYVISWPVPLEIHQAFSILRKGGYQQPVGAVTLRKPLVPGIDQAFYIFNVGNEFIAVGVEDKQIHNFGPTGREVQQG